MRKETEKGVDMQRQMNAAKKRESIASELKEYFLV